MTETKNKNNPLRLLLSPKTLEDKLSFFEKKVDDLINTHQMALHDYQKQIGLMHDYIKKLERTIKQYEEVSGVRL